VIAWLLVAWSVAAVATSDVPASPLVLVGDLFVWPEVATPLAVVALVVAVLLVVLGAVGIGGLSIESAMRRTALVGQLRFAVTQQDVRAVVLLRRQLASEHHRRRSWLPRLPRGLADRAPVVARDLASVGRWPLRRIIRVLTAALVAAFAARGVWAGTTPLLIVAGGAAYVLGLDALEPLAQEIDHPTIADSIPVLRGRLALQHLVQPVIVAAVAGTVGAAVAVGVAPSAIGWQVAAVTLLVAVPMGVAGAAITVVSDQTVDAPDAGLAQPEVAGPRLLIRLVWPPLVAVLGFVPLLVARAAVDGGRPPVMPELVVAAPFLLLAAAVAGWVRFRDDIHRTMAESMGGTTGGST
jgi:hypothetical protein